MFYDRFKQLAEKRGVSVHKATQDIGLSKSTATKWKTTGATPQGETLQRIAVYFGVSTDYLLSGERGELETGRASTKNDTLSIEERADQLLSGMVTGENGSIMLDGYPASQEAVETFRNAVMLGIELARKVNKEKGDKDESGDAG